MKIKKENYWKKEGKSNKKKLLINDNYVFAFNLIIYVNIYHNESFDNITFSSSLDNDPYYTF